MENIARVFARQVSQRCNATVTRAGEAAWRWRILYLRGLIDSELLHRNDKLEGPALKGVFEELTKIYYSERNH